MDDLVAWWRGALDAKERAARAAGAETWYLYSSDLDPGEGVKVWDSSGHDVAKLHDHVDGVHIALHDPRSVLARVEAERMILDRWDEVSTWTYSPARKELAHAIRALAYGHRHDVPGYVPAWAPEGAEVAR